MVGGMTVIDAESLFASSKWELRAADVTCAAASGIQLVNLLEREAILSHVLLSLEGGVGGSLGFLLGEDSLAVPLIVISLDLQCVLWVGVELLSSLFELVVSIGVIPISHVLLLFLGWLSLFEGKLHSETSSPSTRHDRNLVYRISVGKN